MAQTVPGQLSSSAASPEMLQWAQSVNKLLAEKGDLAGGTVAAQAFGGPQVWTGQSNSFTGGKAENSIAGFDLPTVKISRNVPQSYSGIDAALLIIDNVPSGMTGNEWSLLVQVNNASTANSPNSSVVGVYSQVFKKSSGWTWGSVLEAQDTSGIVASALLGMEIDVCFNGVDTGHGAHVDGWKNGIQIAYGDATPNTLNPAGAPVRVGDLIQMIPFGGINRFSALRALNIQGSYNQPVIDMDMVHDTPFGLSLQGGVHMRFWSGNAGYVRPYWYPNAAYVPTWLGAIEIVIDGTFYYIPVASNMP